MGRDISVGIATRYSLEGLEIEFWLGGEIFRNRPDRTWVSPSLPWMSTGSFPGVKRLGRDLKKEYSYTFLRLWAFVDCSGLQFNVLSVAEEYVTNNQILRLSVSLFL